MIKDSDFMGTVCIEKKKRPVKPRLVLRLSYQDWDAAPDRADFILRLAADWARAGRDPLRLYTGRKPEAELTRAALEERLVKLERGSCRGFQLKSSLKDTGDRMKFLFKNVTRDYWERSLRYSNGETLSVIAEIPIGKMGALAPYALEAMLEWMRALCPPGRRMAGEVLLDSEGYAGADGVCQARWAFRQERGGPADRRPALTGQWLELLTEARFQYFMGRYGGEPRFSELCRTNGLYLEKWDGYWALRMARPLEDTPEFYDDLVRVSRALFEAAAPLDEKEKTK